MHHLSRSKATTDDVQVHTSEATTDIVNLATDLVTAYTGRQNDDWMIVTVIVMLMMMMTRESLNCNIFWEGNLV